MELVRFEIKLSLVKGILVGIKQEDFIEEDVIEKDIELYFGIFRLTTTLIYN
jgi:hypothetical protein